ncbi:MAG: MG2 domain protein [bacterium ADurb.Bin363]|nr:MAG: MG2 domain protein [bacterium ADurb.Bin363]
MKRSVLLFLLLFFLLSTAGFADKESYYLSFYCNSYFLYPGEKIPVNVSLYYYNLKNLKKTGDLTENINFKIYKIPSDLTADKYKDYTVQNAPVKEISKTVTINNNNNNYWEGYLNTELPELTSGIYYIVGSTPKTSYKATIRVSKIGMSAKMSTESIIFFVQDRKTGQPIDKAEVNLFLPQEVKKFKTDKEGLINIHIQELGDIKDSDRLRAVVHKGEDTGAINLSIRVEEEIFKGYIYTDRPVYRPSQKVIFKGILRVQKKNNLDFASNEDINIIIKDAKNTEIYKKTLKTDSYGAVSGDFTLSEEPPLGTYYIICTNSKNQKATGTFQVQEYRKPEFEITIKPEKEQYVQGDKMTFNMEAKYYFGAPVPEREYTYQIYREYYYPYCCYCWWDEELMPHPSSGMELVGSGKGKTDKYGHAFFSCKASKVNYDANYNIMVRMTDESRREVTGFTNTLITRGAFYMTLTSDKYLYKPGEQVHIKIEAKDYSGKPVETAVTSKVKYEYYDKQSKKWLWQNIKNIEFKTDKNGIGSYDFITDKDGYYELECTSEDQNKNKIRATGYVYSYSDGGYYNWYRLTNLEIIPDKKIYEPGEQANFFIVCPFEGVKALVTVEGEKIFTQKVVDFANRTASFKVNITKNHTPNFYIGISFYYNGQFYYQNKQIICPSKDKFLTISIEADKEKYRPRDTAKFILKTTDKDNRPVTSQVTMGVADESVYAVVSDSTRNIQKFFYDFKKNLTCTYSSDGYVFRRNYFDNDLFSEEDIDILPQAELKSLAPSTADSMKPRGVDLPDRGGVNLHDQKPLVQPKFIRSFFPDTAYFNPNIITNERGYAEVIFSMPDTLTTWRATARSVTTDTKVGENNKKIIVTKDLLARLITPRFFTQRDETLITGIVHNYLNTKKTVQVKLEIDGGIELVDKAECKVEVPPNGSTPIDWKIKVSYFIRLQTKHRNSSENVL